MKNKINLPKLFSQFNINTPGCSVCVVKNGVIKKSFCVGLADVKNNAPIIPATAFRLASLSKQFTTLAIMILKEKRLLNFDDKLKTFFPDFPDYGKDITLRRILSHTSGLPDHEEPLYRQLKKGQEPTIYGALEVLKKETKTLFKPGLKYLYSDAGFVILAIIIEKLSGQKYAEFLKQNIFLPLRMKNTWVLDETKPFIKNRALGYKLVGRKYELFDYDPLNYIVGDEGVYSTAEDLILWRKAWSNNLIVSYKTLKEALTIQKLNNGKFGRCGFSWFIDSKRKIIYQDGFWVGFTNIILTNYEKEITVVVLSNTTMFDTEAKRINMGLNILKLFI